MTAYADTMPIAPRLADPAPPALARPPTSHPATALADPELHIEIHSDAMALAALGPEWNALFALAGRPQQVFQSHAFCELFASSFKLGHRHDGSERDCTCKLAIVTIRRIGRLVLVFPLVESRQLGNRILSWLGEPIAQYGDALVDTAEDADTLLRAAIDHLKATLKPDIFRLRKVRSDAAVAPVLAQLGVTPYDSVEAPCVTLAAGGSAFEDRQTGKAKKNRRRLMRRLEENGTVTFGEIHSAADATSIVRTGLQLKRNWLVRRGHVSPALSDPGVDAFLQALAADGQRATGWSLFALSLDDRPVAVAWGFRCRQRLMLHFITHAADVEKSGVGVLNLEAILRLAEAEGLEALDLLPPKAEYKLDWADVSVTVADYTWGHTARGRVLGNLLDRAIKPTVKRTIEALPLSVRQRLSARFLSLAP